MNNLKEKVDNLFNEVTEPNLKVNSLDELIELEKRNMVLLTQVKSDLSYLKMNFNQEYAKKFVELKNNGKKLSDSMVTKTICFDDFLVGLETNVLGYEEDLLKLNQIDKLLHVIRLKFSRHMANSD